MSGSDNINSYSVIVRTNRNYAKVDGKKLSPFVVGLTVAGGDFHQQMITFNYSAVLFMKLKSPRMFPVSETTMSARFTPIRPSLRSMRYSTALAANATNGIGSVAGVCSRSYLQFAVWPGSRIDEDDADCNVRGNDAGVSVPQQDLAACLISENAATPDKSVRSIFASSVGQGDRPLACSIAEPRRFQRTNGSAA